MTKPTVNDLVPGLIHRIELSFCQVYLCAHGDSDGLTLVDSGPPGAADEIVAGIELLGFRPEDLSRILLTHAHRDHSGGAPELVRRYAPRVYAHGAEVPYLQHERPVPPPVLLDSERPLFERTTPDGEVGSPTPVTVDRAVEDEETLPGEPAVRVLRTPGHTPGSVAYHVPEHRLVLTGDTVARGDDGVVIPGVFHHDRSQVATSLARLERLDVTIAGFGHGAPALGDAAAQLRQAARRARTPDS